MHARHFQERHPIMTTPDRTAIQTTPTGIPDGQTPTGAPADDSPPSRPATSTPALLVIDVQNDYFSGGVLPLWQADETATHIARAIRHADAHGWAIIAVRHEGLPDGRIFRPGTSGASLHPHVLDLLTGRPLVIKRQADAFLDTDLNAILEATSVTDLYLCGMMTQNCITHTALSPDARRYTVHVLADCCSAPSALIHDIAVRALKGRLDVRETLATGPHAHAID